MKNPQLKAAYAEDEYTLENVANLKRCMSDPIFFMTNYIKVQHPTKGMVPFELYEYQKDMIDILHNNRNIIILASRQLGKCFDGKTTINTIRKPKGFKKLILKFIDRNMYDRLFKDTKSI